jgi:hypothetical protein
MMRAIIAMLALSLGTAPAFAHRCPQELAEIDEVLRTADLSYAVKDDLMKYRKEAEDLHNAGKHREAEEALAKAIAFLEHAH